MRTLRVVSFLALLGLLLQACRSGSSDELLRQQEDLHQQLLRFSDSFALATRNSADRIREDARDPVIGRNAVIWKVVLIPMCRNTVVLQEPLHALIDVWCLCLQGQQFFEGPGGLELFGPHCVDAARVAATLSNNIDSIAREFLEPGLYARAHEDVTTFAADHPIVSGYGNPIQLPSSSRYDEQDGRFEWINKVPLSLGSLVGLDKSAQAIQELAQSTDRFTNMASHLPEQLQWTAELLMIDLGFRQTTADLSAQGQIVADSAASFAATADRWSKDADRVIQSTLTSLDTQHQHIQQNLTTLQATSDTVRKSVEGIQASITDLGQVIDSTAPVASSVQETATALVAATASIERTTGLIFDDSEPDGTEPDTSKPTSDPESEADTESRPFDVTEYTAAAAQIEKASDEIRALLEDIKEFGGSPELDQTLGDVQGRTRDTVDHTSDQARSLVDHITVRAIQVVAVLLAAGLMFVMVRGRLSRGPAKR